MSTILKSLKRLEKETAKEKAVPVFSTRQAMHRTVPFAWLKGRFMRWSLLAVVLIAGGVVWYAYGRPGTELLRRLPQSSQRSRMAHKAPHAGYVVRPVPQQPKPSGAQHRARMTAPTKMMPNGAVPLAPVGPSDISGRKPAPSVAGHTPVSPPPQTERPIAASPAHPDAGGSSPRPSARMTPSQKSTTAVSAAVAPSRKGNTHQEAGTAARDGSPFANAETMSDGRLKVQAIVWAPKADDRMAVINSRIVREGSVIDGFSVIGIGEDAVYVKEGGRMLKVPFGRP